MVLRIFLINGNSSISKNQFRPPGTESNRSHRARLSEQTPPSWAFTTYASLPTCRQGPISCPFRGIAGLSRLSNLLNSTLSKHTVFHRPTLLNAVIELIKLRSRAGLEPVMTKTYDFWQKRLFVPGALLSNSPQSIAGLFTPHGATVVGSLRTSIDRFAKTYYLSSSSLNAHQYSATTLTSITPSTM